MTLSADQQNITKPVLRRLTRQEAPSVVAAWRSSGLSATAYGATIGVSAQNIYQWASDLRKEAKRRDARDADSSRSALQRVSLRHADPAVDPVAGITIVLDAPPRVLVGTGVDEASLRCVLRALSL